MSVKNCIFVLTSSFLLLTLSVVCLGQSNVSGDITGIVTDPSGAVLPNVAVTLTNTGTGAVVTANTNDQGVYRFSLLQPGTYTVEAKASGFQGLKKTANVTVGGTTTQNMQLAVGSGNQTIEVSAEGGVVQTQNGNVSTTFSPQMVSLEPNPGNDLTYIIQSAPGATMNTQAGYGNASTFGLPATSNVFTVNGQNENDPFLNLNNSGATNLLLGQNDVQEVTVVNNGYTGQYGQLAGANVNYVTKSGTNSFHGNANYYWNGSAMNANNYFNDQAGVAKPFDNANQWGAGFGGPLIKNKTFFFVNTEGLRVLLPTSAPVNIPSPQYQAATLGNLGAISPGSIPFYQNMFSLWNAAPGATGAADVLPAGADSTGAANGAGGGCGSFTALGPGVPCALQFRSTASNFTHEWLFSARVDQNFSSNDRMFIHFRTDHGVQATYTDPINAAFNAQSDQPQYEGQLNETHTINSHAVNQFILSGSWYSALFAPPSLTAATDLMPFRLGFAGNAFFGLGRDLNDWPQGRNVTQYQIVDDISYLKGDHSLKFGVAFRRNDMSDYSPGIGSIGYSSNLSIGDFFNGVGTTYTQNFPVRLSQPVALYNLSFYAQDEWAIHKNLKLTLALRAEHNSNPVCQTDCFARLANSFPDISHDVTQPYNEAIVTGLHQALDDYTNVDWLPRFGFAWTPLGADRNTVVRGGFGLFSDAFPATVADSFLNNSPLNNQFVVGTAPLSPDMAGNQAALAAGANSSFTSAFANSGTLASITASNPFFTPPSIANPTQRIHSPRYQEWNLELQQGFGQKMSVSLNYVGNHGIFIPLQNTGVNAFCDASCGLQFATATGGLGPFNSGQLPVAAPDPRFGSVTEISSSAVSNYNGLTVSFQRRFSQLQLQANYTWSHALDEISNSGFLPFNFLTNTSLLNPQDPSNLRTFNYGNADYDVRHYFTFTYVWDTPRMNGWVGALANWTLSGTIFARSGYPFTAVDSTATGILNSFNFSTSAGSGPQILANYPSGAAINCDRGAVTTPCLSASEFTPATAGFGNQRRNQLYGPNYFDTDLTVTKNFSIPHWEGAKFGVGFQFFNLLNHPNFDQPIGDIQDPQFGTIVNTVNTPTSILGSFLGGDASPRLIQVKGTLTF